MAAEIFDHAQTKDRLPTRTVQYVNSNQPGTNADSDVDEISNLAMADLRRMPPGTLPPVVMKFDASSLPVCLITLQGQGLTETQLRDLGQFTVRNQIATAPGASIPPPFGGKYRQIMVYVDPLKLRLSVMDVVRGVNNANLILPAGDAKIGPYDYNIYINSQIEHIAEINNVPLKTVGGSYVTVGDIGTAQDAHTIQTNIVRVSAALGYEDARIYSLVDEPIPGPPPPDVSGLVTRAIANRPELASLRFGSQSAHRFAKAERDLWFPTVSIAGAAGWTPLHQTALDDRYAAAGVNINIPIFNGRLFSARADEARLRAATVDQGLRDEADRVAQNVRMAWLNAQTAFQRIALTQQLLDSASSALDLAQQRYKLGLGSIVELSQAQLNQTQALIEQSSAKYDYQAQIANLNYQIGTAH